MSARRISFLCLVVLLISTLSAPVHAEEQVKWTPNPEDSQEGNAGPLPLSSRQRQQLLQLEEVIRTSENPDATLEQAAAANNMSPQDLLSMLQRNRSDIEGGASANPLDSTIGHKLAKLMATIAAVTVKAATNNPRAFILASTAVLFVLLVAFSAPRTGIMISGQRSLLSKGPTTVFQPPTKFLNKQIGSAKWQQRDPRSTELSPKIWDELTLPEDGSVWHSLPRKSDISKAASAQITIPVQQFLEEGADEDDEAFELTMDLCYNHAVDVITSRWLTEYAPEGVKLHTLQQKDEGRKRFAVLIVKKMGDYGRYGLIPLQVTGKQESDTETSLTFSSLRGAPFTGQIYVSAKRRIRKKGAEPAIVLSVHLAVPKKGNKVSRKAALKIVDAISTSMASSVRTRTRQSLARRGQSSRFRGKANERAVERRTTRAQKQREIEEMAEDRRRRWQRNNPNAGRWRPTGDRMKSPNNC